MKRILFVLLVGCVGGCMYQYMNAGNLGNLAVIVGSPGDLGTDGTVTGTLLEVEVKVCENQLAIAFTNSCLGDFTDTSLDTADVDTKIEIDNLQVSVITLLKTILAQVVGAV